MGKQKTGAMRQEKQQGWGVLEMSTFLFSFAKGLLKGTEVIGHPGSGLSCLVLTTILTVPHSFVLHQATPIMQPE